MSPLNVVMHLVLGADKVAYETGPMTFGDVVDAVRCGQYRDVHHVLSLTFEDGIGTAADVTRAVAERIFYDRGKHPLSYRSDAYIFVEREMSCWHAEKCAWEDAIERHHEQRRDVMRDVA